MIATFHKASGSKKSAWVTVRPKFSAKSEIVVVPMEDVKSVLPNPVKGQTFEVPDTMKVVDLYVWNAETEESELAVHSETGEVFRTLSY